MDRPYDISRVEIAGNTFRVEDVAKQIPLWNREVICEGIGGLQLVLGRAFHVPEDAVSVEGALNTILYMMDNGLAGVTDRKNGIWKIYERTTPLPEKDRQYPSLREG